MNSVVRILRTRYKIENWAEYDAALRWRPRGYSDVVIETGLMLRLAFGRPWRQSEGLLGSTMELLGLNCRFPITPLFRAAVPTWVSRRP
jgi:hypothetical protein